MQTFKVLRRSAILLTLVAISLLPTPGVHAQQAPADVVLGTWEADDGSVKLNMYKAGSELQAHLLYGNEVVEADNVTFKKDMKNPDPALRSRSLKNIVFIWGLRWDNEKWSGGTLYDGSSGRTYRCNVEFKDGKMQLRGYLGISVLGQTRSFHRVNA
jgi:uncharacterized protein (DUF2147 family)